MCEHMGLLKNIRVKSGKCRTAKETEPLDVCGLLPDYTPPPPAQLCLLQLLFLVFLYGFCIIVRVCLCAEGWILYASVTCFVNAMLLRGFIHVTVWGTDGPWSLLSDIPAHVQVAM